MKEKLLTDITATVFAFILLATKNHTTFTGICILLLLFLPMIVAIRKYIKKNKR